MSKEKLWKIDLEAFLTKLDEVEEQERLDDAGRNSNTIVVVVFMVKHSEGILDLVSYIVG